MGKKIDSEADGMYFIESGTVVILDKNNRQINMLHVGQYFGEYAVLSGQRRLSTVRSKGRTVLYRMAGKDLLDFLYKHPGIDDCLNMITASYTVYTPAKEKGVVREKLALFYSMLPTVLCSFIPLSLWGIFVTGTLFTFGLLPASRQLKEAQKRYEETSELYPKGSEKYLSAHDTEVWGRISNVILPVIVLAVSSLTLRSITGKSFITDHST